MIKFGTSGWRGIIADDFTFANVRLVTQSICEYLKESKEKKNKKAVIIGYDTRFLSEKFAAVSAQILAANGIKALLCDRDTPTPVISYEILRRKVAGGINFTASHNPFQYNGLKFSPSWGGPALPETTRAIEKYCKKIKPGQIKDMDFDEAVKKKLIEFIDPKPYYIKRIKELVDLEAIKKSNIKIAIDVLNGTGAGYLDEIIKEAGIKYEVIRTQRDTLFGGKSPEPSKDNLVQLVSCMEENSCSLGLATDGDADRFGILDTDKSYINPNQVISVLLYHLITVRGWTGVVARSVMTTHLIDRIAEKFNLKIKETPVGFKYIGEILINEGKNFIIGGEESGGLSIRKHVPEKDGILACLLIAEMMAISKKTIKQILLEIEQLVGSIYSERVNFHLSEKGMEKFRSKLKGKMPNSFAGIKLKNINKIDGYKFLLEDGSWFGIRLSGTEPVVRLYIEADSQEKVDKLILVGRKFINS